MIEINLLPEELKKRKKPFQMPDISLVFMPILMGIVALLFLTQALLMLAINLNQSAYAKMNKEWKQLEPQKNSVELTRKENMKAKKKVRSIETLMDKKIFWSKKLNQLSDLIIPGVWFTKLSIGKKTVIVEAADIEPKREGRRFAVERLEIPYFDIEGEVSTMYGEELAIIGKFIEQLKNDDHFFKDFSNIELGSTELHSIEDVEVMKFNINCYFREKE